jgi:peptidoglycan/LPS O-acetylase OafA/YrhL
MHSIEVFTPNTLTGIGMILFSVLFAEGLLRITTTRPVLSLNNRMQSLDGLRGLLAMGVFVGHFVNFYYYFRTGEWGGNSTQFNVHIGSIAVALFFMLTGFLFSLRLFSKGGRMDWITLYISRIFRITPLYWFMVAALVVIVYRISGATLQVTPGVLLKQIGLWLSFTNYPNLNKYSETFVIVAGVVWTIKYEWIFYLSLPLQAIFIRLSEKRPWVLVLLAALVIGLSIMPQNIGYFLLQIKTSYFIYFLVGGLAAWLYGNERYRAWSKTNQASLIALIAILAASLLYNNDYARSQTIFLAAFFIPVALGNSLFGILELRSTRLLGDISYGVYLLHGMIIFSIYSIFLPGVMAGISSPTQFYLAMGLTGIAVFLVCWLTYSLIEKPFIQMGKLLASRFQPAAK